MRAKIYERYYKRGFDHMINKGVLQLKKPKKDVQIFYLAIMAIAIVAALLIF